MSSRDTQDGGTRYWGGIEPRSLYRVVADEDAVLAYSATPDSPEWRLDFGAFTEIDNWLGARVFELTRDESMFLLHLWGGRHDALDDPASPRPAPIAEEPATMDEDAEIMERLEVFRALRDLGGKKRDDELKIVKRPQPIHIYDSPLQDERPR